MGEEFGTNEVIALFDRYVIGNYTRNGRVVVRGEGTYVWDADGRRYLDFFSGWAVTGVGHCHPRLVKAIQEQAARIIFMPNTWYSVGQGKLAQYISETSFGGKCFFCNSGAEANEAALKLARRHTPEGKYKYITFENSFHGRTFGALTATAQSKYHEGFLPLVPGFMYAPLNDFDAVASLADDETCAILVEPMQGEGGINFCEPEFLQRLRALCDERGMVLIFDEVQCGVGRTGKWYGYQNSGVEPDIMTLAKQLGGGVAIGAICAKDEVAASMVPGSHASTFGGNPLAAAAACAVFEIIREENLLQRALEMGAYITERLGAMKEEFPVIREVRGRGLMIGAELSVEGASIVAECLERGLHINCTHGTVLRLMPPLTVSREEVDEALSILSSVLGETASS